MVRKRNSVCGGKAMYQVIKRDGKSVDFDLAKIGHAVALAFDACNKQYNSDF